jgi:hypothetical protein
MDTLIGRTIRDILAEYQVDYSAIRLIDEPPGKLRGVELTLQPQGKPQRVFLEIESSPALFSQARQWPQDLVEQQKVVRVHTSRDQLF